MRRSIIVCLTLNLLLSTGCCTVHGWAMHLAALGPDARPDIHGLVILIGKTLKPFGFTVPPQNMTDSELTVYSLRQGKVQGDQIDVILNHKDSTVRLVDFQSGGSPSVDQIKTALERGVIATYGVRARFEDTPCGWFGP